jgi:hypothetical protein
MRKTDLLVITCAILAAVALGHFEGREPRPIVQPSQLIAPAPSNPSDSVRLGYKDWSLEVPEKQTLNRYLDDVVRVSWPAPPPKFPGEMVCTEITATSARSWAPRGDGLCYVADAMPWPKTY